MKPALLGLALLMALTACVQSTPSASPELLSPPEESPAVPSPQMPEESPAESPKPTEPVHSESTPVAAGSWAALWNDAGVYRAPDGGQALPAVITAAARSILTLSAEEAGQGLLAPAFVWGTLRPLAHALASPALIPDKTGHSGSSPEPAGETGQTDPRTQGPDPVPRTLEDGQVIVPGWRMRQYAVALYDFQKGADLPALPDAYSAAVTLDAEGNALLQPESASNVVLTLTAWTPTADGTRYTAQLLAARTGEAEHFAEVSIELYIRPDSLFGWAVSAAEASFG